MDQTKGEKDTVGESLKDDDIEETKVEIKNTIKEFLCNICGIYFMYEEGLFSEQLHNMWHSVQCSQINYL